MKIATQRKQRTHDRIVDTAARLVRGRGFEGVGVADVMKRAGLTHGGFYAHFPSRDALLAEALERTGEDNRKRVQRALRGGAARGESPFRAFVDNYLSDLHLRSPESGCAVAALSCEMPRQAAEVRRAARGRVDALVAAVDAVLPAGHAPGTAGVVASQLVGAVQVARVLGNTAAGRGHLAASRRFLIDQFDHPRPARR